jgi:hypothetical protein
MMWQGAGSDCHHTFHINHFSVSRFIHGLAKFGGNPGFLMLDHESYHLSPFFLGRARICSITSTALIFLILTKLDGTAMLSQVVESANR